MRRSVGRFLLGLAFVVATGAISRADDPPKAPAIAPPPSPSPSAAGPTPSSPAVDSRAAVSIPDDIWSRSIDGLGLSKGAVLGFTAEQMANYGRDQLITRPIATLFRDVRAIPRYSGKLSDTILEAAKDPSELVRIAFGLTDAVAGRMLERPKGAAWGVDWLAATVSPSDALATVLAHIAEIGGAAPTTSELSRENLEAWRSLPEAVQRLVVRTLVGCAEGASWIRSAFDAKFLADAIGMPTGEGATPTRLLALASRPFIDADDDAKSSDRAATRASFALAYHFDKESLAYGCIVTLLHLSVGIEEWRLARDGVDVRRLVFPGLLISTAMGPLRILGPGDDVEDSGVEPALLELDLGGDDIRRGRQGVPASLARPISLVVDLGGNDRYEAPSTNGTFGCGLFGLGAVVDLAGNDAYEARESSLGCGWYGAGLVYDEAGNDRYVVAKWGQGAGHFGVGVLADLAGNDTYECAQQSQAMGSTLGAGLLLDVSGNDAYVARDDGNQEKIYLDQSVAMAQGCGYGRRADLSDGHSWAGGFGVLVDGAGDDRYHAQVWSQGAGYWWAVGILEDRGGDDVYENGKYSSGAGAHFAIGCHVDLAGNDRYNMNVETAVNQYQGHARDGSIGIFVDGAGNDAYRLRNHCAGAGDLCSIGLFWDRKGDDVYEVRWNDLGAPNGWNETPPFGAATTGEPLQSFRDDLSTYGLFLDTGGKDAYRWDGKPQQDAKDGATWTRKNGPRSFGFGLDRDAFPPTPSAVLPGKDPPLPTPR